MNADNADISYKGESVGQIARNAKRDPQTYAVLGAAIEVHNQLGCGFLEAVYQEAFAWECGARRIPFQREAPLTVQYKGVTLPCKYRADFIFYDAIIVELKALDHITGLEQAQVLNYLKVTGLQRGLLLNFGALRLEYQRLVWNYQE